MGLKLSLFKKGVEEVHESLAEASEDRQETSEPTPNCCANSAVESNVERKCSCVECKCQPCQCTDTEKDIPVPQTITDKPSQQSADQIIDENSSQEATPIESQTQSTNTERPANEEVIVAQTHECPPEVSPSQPEESPKVNDKCLCDPCHCDPCACGSTHEVCPQTTTTEPEVSETTPSTESMEEKQVPESDVQTIEHNESQTKTEEYVEQEVPQQLEPPNSESQVEEARHETEGMTEPIGEELSTEAMPMNTEFTQELQSKQN